MKTISLNPLGLTDYVIKVGQCISYSFVEHSSVGISAEYYIDNEAILGFKKKKIKYKNPRNNNLSGADKADSNFIFEGKTKGISLLIIRNMFRGDVENEFKFSIEVI